MFQEVENVWECKCRAPNAVICRFDVSSFESLSHGQFDLHTFPISYISVNFSWHPSS